MEMTNQFVNSRMNKTTAIVVILVEPLLGHSHTLDNFYHSLELAYFLKSKETDCVGTLHVNRGSIPPLVKAKELKKGEWFGQHLVGVGVLAWHKKRVMII
jgi:hypothetical protein